jgi:hypothetical protein
MFKAKTIEVKTMEPMSTRLIVGLFFLCCLPLSRAQSASDLPSGPAQAKIRTACLECHDASIIVQQRLGKAAWTKELDKMIKWGALLEAADRDSFIDYLSTNFPPDKAPAEMPRAAFMKK